MGTAAHNAGMQEIWAWRAYQVLSHDDRASNGQLQVLQVRSHQIDHNRYPIDLLRWCAFGR